MGIKEKLAEQAARRRAAVEPAKLPDDWDGRDEVFVRRLTAKDRDTFELSRRKTRIAHKGGGKIEQEVTLTLDNLRARLLVLALADKEGRRIYADADADQVGDVFDGQVADWLFEQALKFNGMDAGEEPEKNSPPLGGNSSASPSPSAAGM